MSKKRRPRVALGLITRADGVRVEVKSPTVWKLLNEQAGKLEAQHQLIESFKGTLTKLEAGSEHTARYIDQLDRNWWIRLGVRLGFVRLHMVVAPPGVRFDVAAPPDVAAASPATS
jgi:hypothetical protein